ncbi:MAG: DUF2779 domain-containing protein [Flavobacteriales bacterium]|nr:DUF2779 domain-containing protein [Flavobacteriales bacterium]
MQQLNFKKILSKSDFRVAQNCATKLHYLKNGYPSANEGNEYMEYLAEGGYAVGEMATLFYPGGHRIDNRKGIASAIEETKELLKKDNITLFEAAILSNGKVAAIDILEKKGTTVNLIEVKSKGYDSVNPSLRGWKDHLEDIAFQVHVLSEAYPEFTINPFFFVPDKAARTKIEGLNSLFDLREIETHNDFKFFDIVFTGDPELIRKDALMVLVDVSEQVHGLARAIQTNAMTFADSLVKGTKIISPLDKKCFNCEYVSDNGTEKSGYHECWKGIKEPEQHVKDLYHVGTIGGTKEPVVNELIAGGKVSLFDMPVEELKGKRGERQLIQIENTKTNTEWTSAGLKAEISSWKYPLHFIDFETCVTALPFHKNMHPYEMSAFQWSCHTIKSPGADPVHTEWLNTEPKFPSFQFAESLMQQIGYSGTHLMWATHENTTLRNIYNQMEEYGYSNPALKKWLEYVVKFDKNGSGTLIDMNRMALDYYFHPVMKGRTSIKVTLPAVLAANKSERTINWLQNFEDDLSLYVLDEHGHIENPYKHLPQLEISAEAEAVNEGTGAMRAYEDMLFGLNKNKPEVKKAYEKALLRYCKLDTLAMVIIWEHWKNVKF